MNDPKVKDLIIINDGKEYDGHVAAIQEIEQGMAYVVNRSISVKGGCYPVSLQDITRYNPMKLTLCQTPCENNIDGNCRVIPCNKRKKG